jgi:predicted nuclease with TOPRIM domain
MSDKKRTCRDCGLLSSGCPVEGVSPHDSATGCGDFEPVTPDDYAEDRRVCGELETAAKIRTEQIERLERDKADLVRMTQQELDGRERADKRIEELEAELQEERDHLGCALATAERRVGELEAAREKDHIGIGMAKGYIAAGRSDDAAAVLETLLKGDS